MNDTKLRYDLDEIRNLIVEHGDDPKIAMLRLLDGLERMTLEITGELSAIRRAIEVRQ